MKINELDNVCAPEKQDRIREFCDWCCEELGIDVPHLRMAPKNDTTALGYTDMRDGSVTIVVGDRHQMDIMRTLAHELVHVRQMKSYEPDGATGSKDENEANAMAGVLMREWGQNNPDLYTEGVNVSENTDEARFSMKKPKKSAQDRFNDRLKDKHGIDLDANLAKYKEMMDKLSAIDSGAPKKADENFGEPSADAKKRAADAQQKNIDDKYVATVDSNSKAGIYKNTSEGIDKSSDIYKEYLQLRKMPTKQLRNIVARANPSDDVRGYDKAGSIAQILRDRHGDRKVNQAMGFDQNTSEGQQCWDGYEKKGTKKMFGKTVNNCVKKESVEQVDESKTAKLMALLTALGATYGLEDEARAFADQIQQNIHNAQTAEPNPGRPDPVSSGNMVPGSDRVMRPPVDEIAPAIAAVSRGVVKGAGAVAKGVGSMVKTAGTRMAIDKMQDQIANDEANEASTTSKILKGAPGAPDGRPKSMREAVNVQSIKDEVIGAVRSGNPREMKRVDDTIAKRISDLMDLRGTAGKEVDAQIKTALPVLKKAQMYLRDKKLSEDAYDDMSKEIDAHAEKFALKGKDLEKYVGRTVTVWMEGSSNEPYQSKLQIEAGNNGQGVTIQGEYYGPEDFVDHNSAADYSWKSQQAAEHYTDLQSRRDELDEAKKDACYNKVRSRYKVWPSAYASGALVQCRKKGAKNWGNKSKK